MKKIQYPSEIVIDRQIEEILDKSELFEERKNIITEDVTEYVPVKEFKPIRTLLPIIAILAAVIALVISLKNIRRVELRNDSQALSVIPEEQTTQSVHRGTRIYISENCSFEKARKDKTVNGTQYHINYPTNFEANGERLEFIDSYFEAYTDNLFDDSDIEVGEHYEDGAYIKSYLLMSEIDFDYEVYSNTSGNNNVYFIFDDELFEDKYYKGVLSVDFDNRTISEIKECITFDNYDNYVELQKVVYSNAKEYFPNITLEEVKAIFEDYVIKMNNLSGIIICDWGNTIYNKYGIYIMEVD